MRDKFLKIFLSLLFVSTILSIVVTYLNIHNGEKGEVILNNSYFDIKYNNIINDNENVSVKTNENNIELEISNDEKVINPIFIDVLNIGNGDALINDVDIRKISCSDELNMVEVEVSLNKDDTISGGEYKKLEISILNNELIHDESKCNININYLFNSLKNE